MENIDRFCVTIIKSDIVKCAKTFALSKRILINTYQYCSNIIECYDYTFQTLLASLYDFHVHTLAVSYLHTY